MTKKKEVSEATNWLGQTIKVGSRVYRGAREGNSTSYKVGVVQKITERQDTAFKSSYVLRVKWEFFPGIWFHGPQTQSENVVYRSDSYGSPDLNTVVLIDDDTWDYLQSVARGYR